MASEEQKQLAAFIKDIHQSLRLQSQVLGLEQAWLQHCQQTDILEKYAENMRELATEFWEKKSSENSGLCRIQWVTNQCLEFFHAGGDRKAAAKEEKLRSIYFGISTLKEEQYEEREVLKLLDVGSCYNPFSKYSMFDVTAIDLSPATQDVLKCDFLTVTISNSKLISPPDVLELPRNYFDVVVFSLLLEYLPSPKQRFKCCVNAYELLKPGGLLFILTPDSKHATANSKVMKSWRYALAWVGYLRVSYQKLKHLHCMAYRKCSDIQVPRKWFEKQQCKEAPEDFLYIPQDFHEYTESASAKNNGEERSDNDNKLLAYIFSDLPDSDIFS